MILLNVRRCLYQTDAKMLKIYKEYIWDNVATRAHIYNFPRIFSIIKELKLPVSSQVLDAGCGSGNLVNKLYKAGYNKVYGVDLSDSGIGLAKKTYPYLADNFFNHDLYEIALPGYIPQKYDLVVSAELLEHLYDPKAILKNLYTWLNKGGYLIITVPYHGYLKNFLIALLNRFDGHVESLRAGGHIKFFSKNTLIALLNSEGFRFIRFYGTGRIPYCWKSMVMVAKKYE